MLTVVAVSWWLRYRRRLFDSSWFLGLCTAMGPLGFVAVLAGWTTTEVGRQPWIIYGVMRTAAGSSPTVNSGETVFTTIGFEPSLKDCGLWLEKAPALGELQIGGRWVEIDPRLERQEDETVVLKKGASGFFGTNLAAILVSQGVDSVILCGATTSGCVRATAVDLLQNGWPTLVPRECVGDRAQAPHEANLFDIQAKYADVVTLEDALAYV